MQVLGSLSRGTFLRTLRKMIDSGLPIVGVLIVFGAVLFVKELRIQVAIVVIGLLLIEAGVWNLGHQLLPSERTYHALRFEGDQFLELIRQLNATALSVKENDTPENHQAFDDVKEAMHQAVERMADVAGKTDSELLAEQEVLS